jgi:hypothetical protein
MSPLQDTSYFLMYLVHYMRKSSAVKRKLMQKFSRIWYAVSKLVCADVPLASA